MTRLRQNYAKTGWIHAPPFQKYSAQAGSWSGQRRGCLEAVRTPQPRIMWPPGNFLHCCLSVIGRIHHDNSRSVHASGRVGVWLRRRTEVFRCGKRLSRLVLTDPEEARSRLHLSDQIASQDDISQFFQYVAGEDAIRLARIDFIVFFRKKRKRVSYLMASENRCHPAARACPGDRICQSSSQYSISSFRWL